MKTLMSLGASGFLAVQQASPRPAVPVEPVVAIAEPTRRNVQTGLWMRLSTNSIAGSTPGLRRSARPL